MHKKYSWWYINLHNVKKLRKTQSVPMWQFHTKYLLKWEEKLLLCIKTITTMVLIGSVCRDCGSHLLLHFEHHNGLNNWGTFTQQRGAKTASSCWYEGWGRHCSFDQWPPVKVITLIYQTYLKLLNLTLSNLDKSNKVWLVPCCQNAMCQAALKFTTNK